MQNIKSYNKNKDARRVRTPGAVKARQSKIKKEALEVLKKTFGNVSLTCEKLGISRFTFYKWRNEDAEFNEAVEDINERTLDFVESKMIQGIQEGNTKLIIFYLNSKGRRRGYGAVENEANKNSAITLKITQDEAEF